MDFNRDPAPILQATVNMLRRMRIGSIPMNTQTDRNRIRQVEKIWEGDRSPTAQSKVSMVSALYL